MDTTNKPISLTGRDLAVIRYVGVARLVALDVLAAEFFKHDPTNGSPNRSPERACKRRVESLAAAGYLFLERQWDGWTRRLIVTIGKRADHAVRGNPSRRSVAPRARAHHLATQDAVRMFASRIGKRGAVIVETKLEPQLRAEAMAGRRTQDGDRYEHFPDAICWIESDVRGFKNRAIAVEYVTSKYMTKDIAAKHAAYRRYHSVFWIADRESTAKRVSAVTGVPCEVLR